MRDPQDSATQHLFEPIDRILSPQRAFFLDLTALVRCVQMAERFEAQR